MKDQNVQESNLDIAIAALARKTTREAAAVAAGIALPVRNLEQEARSRLATTTYAITSQFELGIAMACLYVLNPGEVLIKTWLLFPLFY